MLVNYNLNYKTFDKYSFKKYNYVNFGTNKLNNYKQQIQHLKSSKKLQMSPVAFVVPIIERYLSDSNYTDEDFSEEIINETKKFQFLFSKMNNHDIEDNQRIFYNEFQFADNINNAILQNKDQDNLRYKIISLIDRYKG